MKVALIDGDSIAYAASYTDSLLQMKSFLDTKIFDIVTTTEADKFELYIEEWRKDKINFRAELFSLSEAFTKRPGYKGNRANSVKSPLLDNAREYLVKHWNATVVKYLESEDFVIRRGYAYKMKGHEPIICCIDKDLLQHNFTYYNYNTRALTTLSKEQASLNLWRQVLMGDSTDNIPGIPGIGPKKAAKLVQDSETALKDAALAYIEAGFSYDYFIEQYNLIYIRPDNHTDILKPITRRKYDELKET
jgi:hypothetical protein